MFGKKKKDPGPDPATGRTLVDSQHLRARFAGGIVYAEVKCEAVTDRESKFVLEEIAQASDASGSARVVLDMEQVGVLASAGIGMLVQAHKRLTGLGGGFAIYNLSEDIAQLMKLTRMDKLFTIADDREAAVAAVS